MKRLAISAGVIVTVALMTGSAFARPRFTVIHFTKNFNKTLYPADCLATVATETLPTKNNDQVTWLIRNGNAYNQDDVCDSVDKAMVELRFKDDVFGTAVNKVLRPSPSAPTRIRGTIDAGIPPGAYKYVVYYKGLQAGPDPEVEVGCSDCGGGGR